MRFEWDEDKAAANVANHAGVTFQEAAEVFLDPNMLDIYDVDHSIYEDRYHAIGFSSRRLLTVVFTQPAEDVIRIISAWKATAKEQELYEQENQQGY